MPKNHTFMLSRILWFFYIEYKTVISAALNDVWYSPGKKYAFLLKRTIYNEIKFGKMVL